MQGKGKGRQKRKEEYRSRRSPLPVQDTIIHKVYIIRTQILILKICHENMERERERTSFEARGVWKNVYCYESKVESNANFKHFVVLDQATGSNNTNPHNSQLIGRLNAVYVFDLLSKQRETRTRGVGG